MNVNYIFSLVLIGLIVFACQNEEKAGEEAVTPDLKEELLGTWQTVQINVAINSADGRDTFRTEFFTEDAWKVNNMQPPFYYFQPDQKYRCVRKNIAGEIIDSQEGDWKVIGDTLTLMLPDTTESFVIKSGSGRATWRSFRDWDEDGAADDEYQELQRKVSISTN